MSRRVNPIMLLGLIVVLILSLGILASAQLAGGTPGDALGVGEAQVGKPFRMSSDGPDAFSCAGLIRYIMREIGVDPNAPFSPEGYLGAYPSVAPGDLQPGDIVIFPDHATMYAGNGTVLNANEVEGMVTNTPMDVLGVPLGIVRPPYGGGQAPVGTTDPTVAGKQTAADQSLPVDTSGLDTSLPVDTSGLGTSLPVDTSGLNTSLPVDTSGLDTSLPVDTSGLDTSLPVDTSGLGTSSLPVNPMSGTNQPVGDVVNPQAQF